jgi:hypothetical protein
MKIDADSNGSVGKTVTKIFIFYRMAWIYELYVTRKLNSSIYEIRGMIINIGLMYLYRYLNM